MLTGQTAVHSREIIGEVHTAGYVDIVRGNITPDNMLISMSLSMALSKLVQYISGKSSHRLFQEFEHLRKREIFGSASLARGYFAVTFGNVNSPDRKYSHCAYSYYI
ncbi:MAG: transposase [Wolbachia sp.]|nr:transposase [Wolbachia sp.]MDD9336736.1 transposase [Wolbachia sp.]